MNVFKIAWYWTVKFLKQCCWRCKCSGMLPSIAWHSYVQRIVAH